MTTNNQTSSPSDMLGRAAVMPLNGALEKLREKLTTIGPVDHETIPLEQGLGRVVAQTITANYNLPPQPRSTMDGYAVKAADTFGASASLPSYLKISGEVLMGEVVAKGPGSQECYKIATGGFLPPQTDAVVMLEHTVGIDGELIEVVKAVSPGENIINTGDDIKKDNPVLSAGKLLRPQELGLLAGLGHTEIAVFQKVRVGIFSSGDEIVNFNEPAIHGKVRDMNGINLVSLARQQLTTPKFYGITADREDDFSNTLEKALTENHMVMFSGSSSVGTRDLGERVIEKLASPGIIIHGVAIKPGKPVIVALAEDKPIFGLPGHPVSAAVAFDLFARTAIAHLSGIEESIQPANRSVQAKLKRNLNSAAGRTDFIRVKLSPSSENNDIFAYPVLGKSGALSTMVEADGYFIIPESSQGVEEEETVEVILFD